MRHRKAGIKLNRTASHRDAMFRNMVTSLLKHDSIRTTDAKAKELRRWADRIITLAKRGDLHARRQAMAIVREKEVVHKLFEEAGKRFGSLKGGYTRIVKIGRRPGDAAPISMIELISTEEQPKKAKKKKGVKKKAPSAKPAAATEKVGEKEAQAPEEAAPQEETAAAPAEAEEKPAQAEPAETVEAAETEADIQETAAAGDAPTTGDAQDIAAEDKVADAADEDDEKKE